MRPRAGGRNRGRTVRALVAGLVLVGVLAAVGCTSGSYPVDIFYEQHYQQSFKSHEPPQTGWRVWRSSFLSAAPQYDRQFDGPSV